MQRLYFLTDSNDSARRLTDRLLLERIEEDHIHILANADEPAEKVQDVYNAIRQNVPRTQYCGIEPLQPAFP